MTKQNVISCCKEVLGGTPVFAGTRVPVLTLIDYLESGDRMDDFLLDFPSVTREQSIALLEQMKETLAAQYKEVAD